jgi:hypothetical protein
MAKGMVPIMVAALFFIGCGTSKEQRMEQIQSAHPHWDRAMVEKVAAHKVETGMTPEMVVAALRAPDSVSTTGNLEKWGYSVPREYNMGAIRQRFVYFVYFVDGKVTRTEGDRKALGYWRY